MAMKTEQLQKVLEGEAAVKAEGKGVYLVGDDLDLTVMLDMGQEPLSIGRIKRLVVSGDLLSIETHKGDRLFTSATVRAVKFSTTDANKSRGAGFTSR
jgi:hypothetical protein